MGQYITLKLTLLFNDFNWPDYKRISVFGGSSKTSVCLKHAVEKCAPKIVVSRNAELLSQ